MPRLFRMSPAPVSQAKELCMVEAAKEETSKLLS
jgi:hypothetical protein